MMRNEQDYTPVKTLPGDPNLAIGDVIAAAGILEEIYDAEIDALSKPDSEAFMALQGSKIEAAQTYYAMVTQMIARKNELRNVDPETKRRLREVHERFSNTTRENLRAVKRMKRYSERLGNTIRTAALRAAQRNCAPTYCENGSMSETSPRKIISSGISETV